MSTATKSPERRAYETTAIKTAQFAASSTKDATCFWAELPTISATSSAPSCEEVEPLMTKVTHLTGAVDPDSLSGLYTVESNAPAYGTLKALASIGEAEEMGERYLQDGTLSVLFNVVSPKAHRNPELHAPAEGASGAFQGAIGIGEDYYISALREYGVGGDGWECMFWRECVQNAVDAGAKEVSLRVEGRPDGTAIVSCEDDGSGMDKETIVNKFLMLGGSGKKGQVGATGGFGKAKELLILPWLSWKIESRDVVVEGVNSAYSGGIVAPRAGTKLTVHMPADRKTTAAHAIAVLKKSLIPSVWFDVDGERVRADLEPGEELDAFADNPKLRLYHAKKARKQKGFFIRKNGLFMFSIFMPDGVGGYIVGEVLAPSLEVFNTSRMGFNSWGLRNQLEQYVSTLSKDVRSATRKKKKQFHKEWKGTSSAVLDSDLKAILMQHLGAADRIDDRNKVKELQEVYAESVKKEQEKEQEADAQAEAKEPDEEGEKSSRPDAPQDPSPRTPTDPPPQDPPVGRVPPELIDLFLRNAGAGAKNVEAAVDQITYLPDFYIHGEDWVPPKRITPDGDPMMPSFRKLARFWGSVCALILTRLGCPRKEYGIGWIFEEDKTGDGYTKGETISGESGKQYLLLNPYRGGLISQGDIYSLRDDDDLDIIWSVALHECVHLSSGIGGHDEDFSSALTSATAKASRGHRELLKIRDHVTRRTPADLARIAAAKAAKAARPKAAKLPKFVDDVEAHVKEARKALVTDQKSWHYVRGFYPYRYGGPGSSSWGPDLTLRTTYRDGTYHAEWRVETSSVGGEVTPEVHGEERAPEDADRKAALALGWKALERVLRDQMAKLAPNAVLGPRLDP